MSKINFPLLVSAELISATNKFGPINSLHEGYAIILEELDEFWDAVKSKESDSLDILMELVQVAAMCQRTAMDCIKIAGPGDV
jgi:hypothetical protein